jgi:hypothetical protein
MDDADLTRLLAQVEPTGRDVLRRAMRAEQQERDELALALLRQRTDVSRDLADLLDLTSLNPEVRRQAARVLGALEADP